MSTDSSPNVPASGIPANFPPQPIQVIAPAGEPVRLVLEHRRPAMWFWKLGWIAFGLTLISLFGVQKAYQSYIQTSPEIQEHLHSLAADGTDKVAIIDVQGTIMHADGFVKWQIDRVRNDNDVKAIVVRVDSPGGTVTGSHYIYHQLQKLAEEKKIPIVVSMGGIAASGGYYIAMAVGHEPNTIYAEPTTWTGSIGVIIPHYDVSELMEKYSVKDDSIVSHPLKQMGSPTHKLSPEMQEKERKILQELVDDCFAGFKDIVKSGRPKLTDAQITEVATGQIFTSNQALKNGLVDRQGFIEDAIDRAIELAKLDKKKTRAVSYTRPASLAESLLGGSVESRIPSANINLAALLDLTAPRAYYLCTWLPGVMVNQH